jgi:hypothetical protein
MRSFYAIKLTSKAWNQLQEAMSFFKRLLVAHLVKMPKPLRQKPTNGPYPEPTQSTLSHSILRLKRQSCPFAYLIMHSGMKMHQRMEV